MGYGQATLRGPVRGALLGLLFDAMTGGRRDFASVSGIRAGRYEVLRAQTRFQA